MEINHLEKNNYLDNELLNENMQKTFLETTLGKTINTAIDIGIRAVLPEFLEDQMILIKNNLLNYGLKDGIRKTIDDAIDLGKSVIGMMTGNFENINQMKSAVQSGGLVDGMSSLLDRVIQKMKQDRVINESLAMTIQKGKNLILNNIEKKIEESFYEQYQAIEDASRYIKNWKENFQEKNFEGMEKEYNKIEKQLKNMAPIEKTINDIKKIEILHNLIRNNGQDFNLTQEQLDLAEKLS